MISFATLARGGSLFPRDRCDNRLTNIDAFDAARVVLEQAIYYSYANTFTPFSPSLDHFRSVIIRHRSKLPGNYTNDHRNVLSPLYDSVLALTDMILDYTDPNNKSQYKRGGISFNEDPIRAAFNTRLVGNYKSYEILPNITEDFFDIWLAYVANHDLAERYPDGIISNARLYYPQLDLTTGYGWGDSCCSHIVSMRLDDRPAVSFDIHAVNKGFDPLCRLIGAYSFKDYISDGKPVSYTVNELPAIFACFSFDHDKYIMTGREACISYALPSDICFDLISGSSYTCDVSDSAKVCGLKSHLGVRLMLNTFAEMLADGKIAPTEDGVIISTLLSRFGTNDSTNSEIAQYLTKQVNEITGAEAYAFNNSVVSKIFSDRIQAAMEAAEDDGAIDMGDDDTTDDMSEGTGDDLSSGDDMGGDDFGDEDMGDVGSTDDKSDKIEIRPKIDPVALLLEMAKSNEHLTDYLFKDVVARRMDNIIANPPENATPNDISMIKHWRNRWLFLVSTACVRDFISRLAIRLSDQ